MNEKSCFALAVLYRTAFENKTSVLTVVILCFSLAKFRFEIFFEWFVNLMEMKKFLGENYVNDGFSLLMRFVENKDI